MLGGGGGVGETSQWTTETILENGDSFSSFNLSYNTMDACPIQVQFLGFIKIVTGEALTPTKVLQYDMEGAVGSLIPDLYEYLTSTDTFMRFLLSHFKYFCYKIFKKILNINKYLLLPIYFVKLRFT